MGNTQSEEHEDDDVTHEACHNAEVPKTGSAHMASVDSQKCNKGSSVDGTSTTSVLRRHHDSTKRKALFLGNDNVAVDRAAITQWIRQGQDILLVTSGIEEKTHKNTPQSKLFSRHLTSNCKIIMSSKRDSATNVVSEAVMFTNFAMVDKAVQTDEQTIKQSTKQRPENADAMLNKLTLELQEMRKENEALKRLLKSHSNAQSQTGDYTETSTDSERRSKNTYAIAKNNNNKDVNFNSSRKDNSSSQNQNGNNQNINTPLTESCFPENMKTNVIQNNRISSENVSSNVYVCNPRVSNISSTNPTLSDIICSDDENTHLNSESDEQNEYYDIEEEDHTSIHSILSENLLGVSPNATQGYSFDDILKANLEYLSDDDDLLSSNDELLKKSGEQDSDTDSEYIETQDDIGESSGQGESIPDDESNGIEIYASTTKGNDCDVKEADHQSVFDSAKYWEDKLSKIAKDKGVQEHSIDLDSSSIGNIQKTKLLWQDIGSMPNISAESQIDLDSSSLSHIHKTKQLWKGFGSVSHVAGNGQITKLKDTTGSWDNVCTDPVHNELDQDVLSSVHQTKLLWQEMMTSGQNSGHTSSRRRSVEELEGTPSNDLDESADLEESLGSASKILQKKMLWEGMSSNNTSPSSDCDTEAKRLTLDLNSPELRSDVNKTKMKFEEIAENNTSPNNTPRKIKLVSKTEEELEAEFMSSDVMMMSISDVHNTKSKWEKLVSGEPSDNNSSAKAAEYEKTKSKTVKNFSSLRDKFEVVTNSEENERIKVLHTPVTAKDTTVKTQHTSVKQIDEERSENVLDETENVFDEKLVMNPEETNNNEESYA